MAEEAGTKLFIGGLSWNTDDQALEEAFSKFGKVEAKVIYDKQSNRSKGYGFVTFGAKDEAEEAAKEMNGKEVDGRTIRFDFAQPKQEGERRERSDRGGYGRSGPYDRPRGRGGFRGGRGRGGFRGGRGGRRDDDD